MVKDMALRGDKTLYVSDLDGTLLTPDRKITQYTAQIINQVLEEGFHFTIATARALESATPLIKSLKLRYPFILHNGVALYDPKSQQYLQPKILPCELVTQLVAFFRSNDLNPILYTLGSPMYSKVYYTIVSNAAMQNYITNRLSYHDPRFELVADFPSQLNNVIEINIIDHFSTLAPLKTELERSFGVTVHFMQDADTPAFDWLEITHIEATKKKAIQWLQAYLDLPYLVCFGDNSNDLGMFEIADLSYAVENAIDELKKHATGIIEANSVNGVANFLKKMLSLPDNIFNPL